jgi:probable phosphoglycerate mutase
MPTTPLSERGRRQAERLGVRLAPAGIVRILSSDFVRAIETAAAIAATTGAPIETDPLLRERNFGDIRGTPYNELGRDPFALDYHPPNGESWAMFYDRVARAWELVARVAAETPGNLAVVTHGLVCRVLVDRHLALPVGSSAPELWGNTALTEIDAAAPWQIRTLACCAHLVADDGPSGAQA